MRRGSPLAVRVGVVSAVLGGVLASAVPAVAAPAGRMTVDAAARAEALPAPENGGAAVPVGDTDTSARNVSGTPSAAATVRAAEDAFYAVSRAADVAHWAAVEAGYFTYDGYYGYYRDGYYADETYYAVARAARVAHRAVVEAAAYAGATGGHAPCANGKSAC